MTQLGCALSVNLSLWTLKRTPPKKTISPPLLQRKVSASERHLAELTLVPSRASTHALKLGDLDYYVRYLDYRKQIK
jgi:hypothetical protein